jgi:UDPglucose 6-dehydrogenase
MKICVIGAGYIGLITSACLAEIGHEVTCCDINENKIKMLQQGIIPIHEPGLNELVKKHTKGKNKTLIYSHFIGDSIKNAEAVFLCVNTPPMEDGSLNMENIWESSRTIGKNLNDYKIIIQKSTVPVGTAREIERIIRENRTSPVDFDVVANPEFLREGNAILDCLTGDRIVIGCDSWRGSDKMMQIYAPLPSRVVLTSKESAELIKYAANAYLSMKISYINSIARLCEITGADVNEVAIGIGSDHRIGEEFLEAGIGYGGSCFGKDNRALLHFSKEKGFSFDILKAVERINNDQPTYFMNQAKKIVRTFKNKHVGVLGLSFKPNTDDIRDARSIKILQILKDEGAIVKAYDPKAMKKMAEIHKNVEYVKTAMDAAKDADFLVVLTEWNEFLNLDFDMLKILMKKPLIFDGRNLFDPIEMKSKGFEYYGIGR